MEKWQKDIIMEDVMSEVHGLQERLETNPYVICKHTIKNRFIQVLSIALSVNVLCVYLYKPVFLLLIHLTIFIQTRCGLIKGRIKCVEVLGVKLI